MPGEQADENIPKYIMLTCIFSHGALSTFSKIATSGFSCSRYSTAARKVSPLVPLSSISVHNKIYLRR
jgi:hypothetical protein